MLLAFLKMRKFICFPFENEIFVNFESIGMGCKTQPVFIDLKCMFNRKMNKISQKMKL